MVDFKGCHCRKRPFTKIRRSKWKRSVAGPSSSPAHQKCKVVFLTLSLHPSQKEDVIPDATCGSARPPHETGQSLGSFSQVRSKAPWGWGPNRHVDWCLISWLDLQFCPLPATMYSSSTMSHRARKVISHSPGDQPVNWSTFWPQEADKAAFLSAD